MNTLIEKTTKKEQRLAKESLTQINRISAGLSRTKDLLTVNENGKDLKDLKLPIKAFRLLESILDLMAEGKSFTLIQEDTELSTQKAADLLSVSRPHIVKLLETGEIPFKKTGSHRRIRLEDLVTYMTKLRLRRAAALQELADQAQNLKMGYE